MDDLDRRLMDAMQADADRTVGALAETVASSPATCHRRLRALRDAGVIEQIVAIADPTRSCEPLTVILGISLNSQSSAEQTAFRRFLERHRAIKTAWMTTGDFDYFAVSAFADMDAYLSFLRADLEAHPNCESYRSFVALDTVKNDTARSFTRS